MDLDITQTLDSRLSALDCFDVPHLDEYFGVWSILEEPFRAAVARVRGIDLRAHIDGQQSQPQPKAYDAAGDYQIEEGVAIIRLTGPMMKYVSSLSGGTSTVVARRRIRNAVGNGSVRAILLQIDSPGGTVSGTHDLADDVAAAARQKPTFAYVEDLGASAAYWVASQATKVYANPTAMIGSIGTYAVIEDYSEQAEMLGIKVHVIRAGAFKGAGEPGTEITAEQLAEWQRIVDELNGFFVRGVAAGRSLDMEKVNDLADGRVHIGAAAKKLKLIDGVQSLDETLGQLARTSKPRTRSNAMAEANQQTTPEAGSFELLKTMPQPASFEDLKILCPGADNDFICEQLAKKVTADQGRTAWAEEQNKRLEAKQKEVDEAKARAEAAKDAGGVEPVRTGSAQAGGGETDPVAEFAQRVREEMKTGLSKADATRAVVQADPELHAAYIEAHNANVGPSSFRGQRA